MTIEILYSELTNIYGDLGNIRFLEKTLEKENVKFIYTKINDKPYFSSNKVNMIYMGSMPDEYQELIVKKLLPYKEKLKKLIDDDVIVLFTGTALEIVGEYILEDDKKIPGLNLFDVYFVRDKKRRHNSLFVGTFNNIKLVGNRSQFTFMYGNNKYPFMKVRKGCFGMNKESDIEGINYKNFFATYLLGPILVLNPYFTKYLLQKMNINTPCFKENDVILAYEERLKNYDNDKTRFLLGDHG